MRGVGGDERDLILLLVNICLWMKQSITDDRIILFWFGFEEYTDQNAELRSCKPVVVLRSALPRSNFLNTFLPLRYGCRMVFVNMMLIYRPNFQERCNQGYMWNFQLNTVSTCCDRIFIKNFESIDALQQGDEQTPRKFESSKLTNCMGKKTKFQGRNGSSLVCLLRSTERELFHFLKKGYRGQDTQLPS